METEAAHGEEDLRHLRRTIFYGRAATALGLATAWFPNPSSMAALALGRGTRWIIMHHVLTNFLGKYLVEITEEISTLYAVEDERIVFAGTFRGFVDGNAFARDGALRIEELGDDRVYAFVDVERRVLEAARERRGPSSSS